MISYLETSSIYSRNCFLEAKTFQRAYFSNCRTKKKYRIHFIFKTKMGRQESFKSDVTFI